MRISGDAGEFDELRVRLELRGGRVAHRRDLLAEHLQLLLALLKLAHARADCLVGLDVLVED